MKTDYVVNMDALALLKTLPDKSVDCIVTDPPYGVKKAEWDSVFPTHWVEEAWRVTDRMLVMCGTGEIMNVARAVGRYKSMIILHARNGMTRSNISFGNWIPTLACGEWQWEARPNYIPFNVVTTETINHPDPKPMQAMMKLMDKYTHIDWLICDPFAGSGTTLVAAQKLNRRFIGCDLSAEYIAIAEKRLALPFTQPMFP